MLKRIVITGCVLFSALTFSSVLLASVDFDEENAPHYSISFPDHFAPGLLTPIPNATDLTDNQLLEIGIKIWQNQCGVWNHPGKITHGMKKAITAWEADYAQIGIGQCIWYPADEDKNLQEDWPCVAEALKEKGYPIEEWMLQASPWNNSEEFMADFNGDRLKSLRKMLAKKALVIEQARCIATRLDESLNKIKEAIDGEAGISEVEKLFLKHTVSKNFFAVAIDHYPRGLYALMDYVHFKGEGVLSTETINGLGWGLRQVLEQMDNNVMEEQGAIAAFVKVANQIYPDADGYEFSKRYDTYLTFDPGVL